MEKRTIEFEPFANDDGREYLVPATISDDCAIGLLGLDDLFTPVPEKATDWKSSSVRFCAIPLTVENLVTLEKHCHIKISQQTIDK